MLGDNIFYGNLLTHDLSAASARSDEATIFAYKVHDPERYGVVEFDGQGKVLTWRKSHPCPALLML